jgi:hypothetical protein
MTETLILATVGGVAALVLAMFLPAILELRKPKDAGPRLITENFAFPLPLTNTVPLNNQQVLSDLEEEARIAPTHPKFLSYLSNLESFAVE